jgi:hypothetical protein
MLGARTYGLTISEILWIEAVCQARPGTLLMMAAVFYDAAAVAEAAARERSLEQQIYEIPGILTEEADVIVAGLGAARMSIQRRAAETGRTYPRTYPASYTQKEQP